MRVPTLILLLVAVPALVYGDHKVLPHGLFSSLLRDDELTSSLKKAEAILVPTLLETSRRRGLESSEEIPLDDVFFHINEDTTIELSNLRLSGVHPEGLNDVTPDLKFLNMRLALSMGSLHITGDFNVVSTSVLKVIPVSSVGRISVILSDVHAEGQIGLAVGEKSLQATNFDMTYMPKNVIITVTYETNEGPAVSQVSHDALDQSLVSKFQEDLWYQLDLVLKKELNNMLQYAPMSRLLPEERMIQAFRIRARELAAVANKYIDALLAKARSYLIENNLQTLPLPELYSGFSKKILWVTWHGSFRANKGWVKDVATIRRTSDISLSYDEGTLSVFGSLGLGDLKVGFDYYRAEFMNIGPKGTLKADVGYNSVFIKASVTLGTDASASLDGLRVDNIDDIELHITGLGILNWLVSKIATWVVGFMNDRVKGAVNQQLAASVSNIINLVNPNDYFM